MFCVSLRSTLSPVPKTLTLSSVWSIVLTVTVLHCHDTVAMLFTRFARWLLDVESLDTSSARALKLRINDLLDDVAQLERRFNRLQGLLTGGIRHGPRDEDEDDDELEDDEQDEVLEMIEERKRG